MSDRLMGREPLLLALVVWIFHAALEMAIAGQFMAIALIWAAHGFVLMSTMYLLLRWPLRRGSVLLRVCACVLAAGLFALIQTAVDLWVTMKLGDVLIGQVNLPDGYTLSSNDFAYGFAFKLNFKYYVWLFGFYAAFLALLKASQDRWAARVAAQKAELDALRLQVNPHFLFNALNSLSGLIIGGEPEKAEAMTLSLARYYRGALAEAGADEVTLAEEIEGAESYLELERIRFGEGLTLEVDADETALACLVPPLILQPLIENAVKHGLDRTQPAGALIRLDAQRSGDWLTLSLRNSVARGARSTPGTGTGLTNVRDRLDRLHGGASSLVGGPTDTGWTMTMRVPARTERQP